MNRTEYVGNKHVKGFIEFLVKDIEGTGNKLGHKLNFAQAPRDYESPRTINSIKDGYDAYFWRANDFIDTSLELVSLRLSLCNAYFSRNSGDLATAAGKVFDWGLTPNAAKLNSDWATTHKNFFKSIEEALRVLSSDDPITDRFDDVNCRMNSGFTKVYALLHPGSIIYDGRVGAALGFLVSCYLKEKDTDPELPKLLAFPWKNGPSDANRNPSSGKLNFPKIDSKNGNHALWNIRANWIIQEVVKKCSESDKASWLTGEPLRQLEAALFMIGYEVVGPAPAIGDGAGDKQASKKAKQDKDPATRSLGETKMTKAKSIYSANPGRPRKEIIKKFIDECGLTEKGASTYYGTIKRAHG